MTLRYGELFAGYHGLGMGLQSVLGGSTAWFSEFDKAPSAILAHHWPDVPNHGDITKIDFTKVEPVDVLTGGFPCQDVSHAGRRAGLIRDGEGRTRSGLWGEMLRAITELRPRLVVAENVRGLLSAAADSDVEPCPWCLGDANGEPDMRALGAVLADLADVGYDAWWVGLRAADVGAAHGRFRVFIFAVPATDAEGTGAWCHERGLRPVAQRGSDGRAPTEDSLTARIISERSEVDGASGCHVWTGWTNGATTPYGKFSIGNQKVYAHRAAYELAHGPIPEGHEIDHLCQNTLCVNPDHLEAVTTEENRDRVTQRRTHCKRGHEFTEENTYWVRPGARACQTCRAWQDKVQKARKKGAPEPEPPLLPTPVTNDMGEGKTVDHWDAWTEKMQAKHGNGNGHGKSLAIEAQRLLPTPRTSDTNGAGTHGTGGPDLRTVVDLLLPTPTVNDAGNVGGESQFDRNSVPLSHALLPTPRATDGTKGGPNQRGSSGDLMLPSAVQLLPTLCAGCNVREPWEHRCEGQACACGDCSEERRLFDEKCSACGCSIDFHDAGGFCAGPCGGNGYECHGRQDDEVRLLPTPDAGTEGGRRRSAEALAAGKHQTSLYDLPRLAWGDYAPAIARWETVIGRPAPAPTEPGPKGNPRLSAYFVEWLMGLPEGHVTGVDIPRNAQLKALGNGVVPQQAAAACRWWLSQIRSAAA